MLNFKPDILKGKTLNILCLGAHSDDIEIGCGGTILKLLSDFKDTIVTWIVFSAKGPRENEALQSANDFLSEAKSKKIIIKNFKDGFFPYIGADIKDCFEKIKKIVNPDIIFTHYRDDLHQDHRLLSELTWNTFRDNFIMEYEVVKYDGDLNATNFFVILDETICQKKNEIIMRSFKTQTNRGWFSTDVFQSIMRLRGIESGSTAKYAEGFYCRKFIF